MSVAGIFIIKKSYVFLFKLCVFLQSFTACTYQYSKILFDSINSVTVNDIISQINLLYIATQYRL